MHYTAEQFHRAVLEAQPRTAVFDCDGTLWAPDSGQGFMEWTLAGDLVSLDRARWMRERYRLYEAGQVDEATICGEMVQLYAGLPEPSVREAARLYVQQHVAPQLFPEVLALGRALHASGAELWAVSSTNRWVIEAGVWDGGRSPFAIPPERILAAEVALATSPAGTPIVTETLLSVPTDEAKAAALRAAALPCPDVVFGNSIHDAAMLAIARKASPVNPSPALAALAQANHWPTFTPRAVSGA